MQTSTFDSIIIGTVTSFVVALIVVKYAIPFIKKYSFAPFGWYRIVIGVLILISFV